MSCATVHADLLRAHAVPAPPVVRAHRRDVARWALASGRGAQRDALAAIVGARTSSMEYPSEVTGTTVWTAAQISALLWTGVADWCESTAVGVPAPLDIASTLDTYLQYLSANRLIAHGSDPVASLRRAIVDQDPPRSSRHPAVGLSRVAPVVPIA